VPSKSRKLKSTEIAAFEAKRDIGAEILQSIKDIKAGKGRVVVSSATEARTLLDIARENPKAVLAVSAR
jgi:putative transcriptional regulator